MIKTNSKPLEFKSLDLWKKIYTPENTIIYQTLCNKALLVPAGLIIDSVKNDFYFQVIFHLEMSKDSFNNKLNRNTQPKSYL